MAHDAADVAAVLAFGREHDVPVTFRAGGTSLNGQAQSDGILVDVRRHWGGRRGPRRRRPLPGPAGDGAGPRQPGARTVRAQAGPRPRLDRRGDRGRGDRQQLGRDALRGGARLLLHRPRAEAGAGVGHRRSTPGPTARPRSSSARSRSWRRASPRSATSCAPTPSSRERVRRKFEIKNTMGYRLCAFLDAEEPARDLPAPRGRLRGHTRLHRRGHVRDGARSAADDGLVASLRQHRRRCRSRRRAGRRRGERGRADGRAGADRRLAQHPGRTRALARAARSSRRRCWSSSGARTEERARRRRGAGGGRPRRRASCCARASSPATRRRSRSPGASARGCSG